MLGSKNYYFYQKDDILIRDRKLLIHILRAKLFNSLQIVICLQAFDYFYKNPSKYDGATLVKDLCILDGLDVAAMLHDWFYIHFNTAANIYYKILSDILYGRVMTRMGFEKHHEKKRVTGLIATSHLFMPIVWYKRGFMSKKQKTNFKRIYKILKVDETNK